MDRNTNEMALDDYERRKKEIFERMKARRRRFVERIGYENWNPFQPPNGPLDMRTDKAGHTVRQLLEAFEASPFKSQHDSSEYRHGALDCAIGIVNEDERFHGIFDFCLWYAEKDKSL